MTTKRYLVKVTFTAKTGGEYFYYLGRGCQLLGRYGATAICCGIDKRVDSDEVLNYGYKRVSDAVKNKVYKYGSKGFETDYTFAIIEAGIIKPDGMPANTTYVDTARGC